MPAVAAHACMTSGARTDCKSMHAELSIMHVVMRSLRSQHGAQRSSRGRVGADALASMHAARSARGCVCGGMRTNTSFEIQAPSVRSPQWVHHRSLPPDVPALPPSTVLSSLCPVRSPASPRPRPPPSLPESSPPLGLEFHLFLVRKAAIFVLCSEKMEECTVSKKEASSCHTSNTKLKEFDMTRMTNF